MKNLFLLITLMFFGGLVQAQSDSTDLNFYSTNPVWENADDSLMYPSDMFSQYKLEFDISDTDNFGSMRIELSKIGSGNLIYRKKYTLSELQSLGLISSWHVTFDFENLEKEYGYVVNLVIENNSGTLNPIITKTILP